ncbi:MAG: hypothetical protein IT581_08905 [Verrucomicrobiales bacterium]|nr:hypothetical protein [Verrucomicrobiales bacterium]
MKPALNWILVVLVVATGAIKGARHLNRGPEAPFTTVPAPDHTATNLTLAPVEKSPLIESSATTPVSVPFRWCEVESSDYRFYLANLRATGCPEPTIADIIAADIHAMYETKRKASSASEETIDAQTENERVPRESRSNDRSLWEQEEQNVRALLASPPEWWQTLMSAASAASRSHDPTNPSPKSRRAENPPNTPTWPADPTNLPSNLWSKAGTLTDWHRRKAEATRDLESRRERSGSTAELLAEQTQIEAAFATEFDQMLTPAEREEFDLHFSPTAQEIRNRLQQVPLEEPELRALIGIHQDFDRSMSGVEISGDAFLLAQLRSQSEMAKVLSPEKWQEVVVRSDMELHPGTSDSMQFETIDPQEPGTP